MFQINPSIYMSGMLQNSF